MGAIFDSTGTYRYSLWREWNDNAPRVVFIMLNPSTADASVNDPTIHRCVRFAQTWSYGSLEVVNLFAYRATHPHQLRDVPDPIGAENDRYLVQALNRGDRIILGWGNWGKLHGRDRAILELLTHRQNCYCLGINQSGQPRHPLYVRGDSELLAFKRI